MQAVRKMRLIIQPDPQLWVTLWIMMLTQNKGRKRRSAGRNEPGCDGSFQDHGSQAQQSRDGMVASHQTVFS